MGDVLHALPALQQHDRSEEQQQARVQVVPRPPSLASQSQVLPLGRARSALHSRARPSPSARPILAELVRYALELVPDGFSARTHLLNSQCPPSLHRPKLAVLEFVDVKPNGRDFPVKKIQRLHEHEPPLATSMNAMSAPVPCHPCILISRCINAPHARQVQT